VLSQCVCNQLISLLDASLQAAVDNGRCVESPCKVVTTGETLEARTACNISCAKGSITAWQLLISDKHDCLLSTKTDDSAHSRILPSVTRIDFRMLTWVQANFMYLSLLYSLPLSFPVSWVLGPQWSPLVVSTVVCSFQLIPVWFVGYSMHQMVSLPCHLQGCP